MKKFFATFAIIALVFSFTINGVSADDGKKVKKKCSHSSQKASKCCSSKRIIKSSCSKTCTHKKGITLKAHVCNDQCTKEAHNYKCGEKGHKCTEACKDDHSKEKVKDKTK